MTIEEVIGLNHEQKDIHKDQYRYDKLREPEYGFIAKIIEKIKPKTIADIGCAYGTPDIYLKKLGYEVDTFDTMPKLHSKALFEKEEIPFKKFNIETGNLKKKYDFIVFTEVLEHLCSNPLPTMNKLKESLTDNGFLLLSTPVREFDPPQPMGLKENWGDWVHFVNWKMIPKLEKYEYKDNHHHLYYIWELLELIIDSNLDINNLWRTKQTWTILLTKGAER